MWIALKVQKIKRDGKYIDVVPGDLIPEVDTWVNPEIWVEMCFVEYVEDEEDMPVKKPLVKSRKRKSSKEAARVVVESISDLDMQEEIAID